jgi:hypothetical protein
MRSIRLFSEGCQANLEGETEEISAYQLWCLWCCSTSMNCGFGIPAQWEQDQEVLTEAPAETGCQYLTEWLSIKTNVLAATAS